MSGSFHHRIVMGRASNGTLDPDEVSRVFQLRYDVFHQKLGWQVDGSDEEERDEYDLLDPYYMLAESRSGATGCWRLLPTVSAYMLKNTFSALLRGEPAPCSPKVWELSRFAVTSPSRRYEGQIYLSDLTLAMISELVDFADQRGITEYVTVTSVSVERLMIRAGIPMLRFGDGKSKRVDSVDSVACWIPVNQQFREAVQHPSVMQPAEA